MLFPPAVVYYLTQADRDRVDDFVVRFEAAKGGPLEPGEQRYTPAQETICRRAGKDAEVAVGALLDLPVDWDVYRDKDRGDFVLADGRIISVKGVQVEKAWALENYPFELTHQEHELIPTWLTLGLVTPGRDAVWVAGYLHWSIFNHLKVRHDDWHITRQGIPSGVKRGHLRAFAGLMTLLDTGDGQ